MLWLLSVGANYKLFKCVFPSVRFFWVCILLSVYFSECAFFSCSLIYSAECVFFCACFFLFVQFIYYIFPLCFCLLQIRNGSPWQLPLWKPIWWPVSSSPSLPASALTPGIFQFLLSLFHSFLFSIQITPHTSNLSY